MHDKFKTPALGTLILSFISLFGIMLTTFSSSSANVFNNLVLNIGVLVAFYYGITGLGCAWAFRKTLGKGFRANLTMIFLPFIGGVVLLFVCYRVLSEGGSSAYPVDWTLFVGVVLLLIAWIKTRGTGTFFKQPLVAYTDIEP